MNTSDLPALNAFLNLVAAVLLIIGYRHIRSGRVVEHKRTMLMALVVSAAFLTSYLIYHSEVGSVPYPHQDFSRYIYFAVLVPHIILAAVMVPFVLVLVWYALRSRFEKHRRLARRVWPVWMFVSVSGLIVYMMLHGRG